MDYTFFRGAKQKQKIFSTYDWVDEGKIDDVLFGNGDLIKGT